MYVAGDPSLGLVFADAAGRLPVGGRRRRGQPLLRPRHRRGDEAHGEPARPLRAASRPAPRSSFGLGLAALSFVRAARCAVNVLAAALAARRLPRLRLRLHDVAQAPHAAEHRDRRRGGRRAAAGRLGRGDRRRSPRHRAVPVRDRLLLDAAALLGALAADEGRVRARRRADDAGRPRRGRDAPPDPALHRAAAGPDAAAGGLLGFFGAVYATARWRWAPAFIVPRLRLHRRPTAQRAAHLPVLAAYLALLFAPWWSTPACRLAPAWTAARSPQPPHRADRRGRSCC